MISEVNRNRVLTGSTIDATANIGNSLRTWMGCTIQGVSSLKTLNTINPTVATFPFLCDSENFINIKATTSLGTVTSRDFVIS
jgi:hypothetical protein